MYNSTTESKIKLIPKIGDINIERLPMELTKIYAQIITLKREFNEGVIDFNTSHLTQGLGLLYTLAYNLETLLINIPKNEHKVSIAFVSATAQSLIFAINESNYKKSISELNFDSISPLISSIILFLIGNSPADASEMADRIEFSTIENKTQLKLSKYIYALAKGKPLSILNQPFQDDDITSEDFQTLALDLLWKELGSGIYLIARKLIDKNESTVNPHFSRVIDLSVSDVEYSNQKSIILGPYHLAKLLRILEPDLIERALINTPSPESNIQDNWEHFLKKIAYNRPYLWENHIEALQSNFLNIGTSSILTLPTGAGKSTLAELKIASNVFSGKFVIYLVPTHALEDQVNVTMKALFPEYEYDYLEIDKEFTDIDDNQFSPIQVMTPEKCLTLINAESSYFDNVGLVVFDEFHLIHSENNYKDSRSVDAMYCLISLFTLLPHSDYLLISAMVQNGEEISNWVSEVTGRECLVFKSSWKPTRQLHGCLVYQSTEITELNEKLRLEKKAGRTKGVPSKLRRILNAKPYCLFSLKNIWESTEESDYYISSLLDNNVLLSANRYWNLTSNRNQVAAELAIHFTSLGLKTLVFVNNPIVALSTAGLISEKIHDNTNQFNKFIESNTYEIANLSDELGSIENSFIVNTKNVGVHHGLLLPIERNLIEKNFKEKDGTLALVATATLAQGINLPAEIVIIAGDDRYNEDLQRMESVSPHELLNAAGRAGRAGQSSQGAVIVIPGAITTIDGNNLSSRWWELKDQVFSRSDQCLKVEDPLESFLNSIQDESTPLDINQTNILFRFKSENISELATKKLLGNSLFSYKSRQRLEEDFFKTQVSGLLKRRKELDLSSEDIIWTKEISFKSGIDPSLILDLGISINNTNFEEFINLSIPDLIDWFIKWLFNSHTRLTLVFIKHSTLNQLNKAVGLNPENEDIDLLIKHSDRLINLLNLYVSGATYLVINQNIPPKSKTDPFLTKSRNFILKLIPELSFAFGLLTMITIEIANQRGIAKDSLPKTIRGLASCIREGFDEIEKLNYKRSNKLVCRVETHIKFDRNKST